MIWLVMSACRPSSNSKLTIATSANMQYAMPEITAAFFDTSGIACEVIAGSSGKLTAQIRQGAPFDIFLAADMKYPNELVESGLTKGLPEIYAYGQLILWTTDPKIELSTDALLGGNIRHIAMANPNTAPYGAAALEVLRHYKLYDSVKTRLVYGESIAQTNQFVLSGAADVGLTAHSAVYSLPDDRRGRWVSLSPTSYSPIAQGVVILKTKRTAEAIKFYDFLFSKKSKEILNKFGYSFKPGSYEHSERED